MVLNPFLTRKDKDRFRSGVFVEGPKIIASMVVEVEDAPEHNLRMRFDDNLVFWT